MTRVIWLDNNIASEENTLYRDIFEEKMSSIGFKYATSVTETTKLLNETVRSIVIVSG